MLGFSPLASTPLASEITGPAGPTSYVLTANPGVFAVAVSATAAFDHKLGTSHGTYTLTGHTLGTVIEAAFIGTPGHFVVGQPGAKLIYARKMIALPGAVVVTGHVANFSVGAGFLGTHGTFVVTGHAANFIADVAIRGPPGAFVLTGSPATFTYDKRFTVASGAFTITGHTSSVLPYRKLIAYQTNYNLVGFATTAFSRRLTGTGNFLISGRTITVQLDKTMAVSSATYHLAGGAELLRQRHSIVANAEAFNVTGSTGTLGPMVPVFFQVPGTYVVAGSATLVPFRKAAPFTDVFIYGENASLVYSGSEVFRDRLWEVYPSDTRQYFVWMED